MACGARTAHRISPENARQVRSIDDGRDSRIRNDQQAWATRADQPNDRLTILRALIDEITHLPDVNVINVVVDKRADDTSDVVFDRAWRALIQRFEDTLSHRNFPGPANPDERGLIICDETDQRLNSLLRRMRRYNPVPNKSSFGRGYRDLRLKYIIEDPVHRDSKSTYFLQAVDTTAFFLYQELAPNSFIRRKGAKKYFRRLLPVLCTVATKDNHLR